MNAKKLSVSIFLIIFILFGAISAILYDASYSVGIIGYENSYAEKYAKEHGFYSKELMETFLDYQ